MAGKEAEDMTEIVLKDAAAEIGVDPSYLRRRILQGRLKADKHGGRDWWIRRCDLKAFDEGRRPVGRPPDTLKEASRDAGQERERKYQREYRREYREGLKKPEAEGTPPGRSGQGIITERGGSK